MLVFLDTEFTDLLNPELLSLGLVTLDSGADALAVLRLEFAELKGASAGMVMRCTELQGRLKALRQDAEKTRVKTKIGAKITRPIKRKL